jgi:hypothetical protein
MLGCEGTLWQVCATDYCAPLCSDEHGSTVGIILRLNVSYSIWNHFISEFSHMINSCIYFAVKLCTQSMEPGIYYDIYNFVNAFFPKYWHFRTLSCAWYHNYLDWLLQFPTVPEIFSSWMLPLLTLLCFSTYAKNIHILYMKRIHPTIIVLKY